MATNAKALQQQMQTRATARLLGTGDWVPLDEIARLSQGSASNAQARVLDWLEEGRLFSIQHEGNSLYPTYALNAQTGAPLEGLAAVLDLLQRAGRDGWAIAWWLDSPNSYLDGRRPKDSLAPPLDLLLRAAHAESQGAQHG